MIDEDSGENIVCPYCKQLEGCDHILVVLDFTFGEWVTGFAADKRNLFDGEIVSSFGSKMLTRQQDIDWGDYNLNELWREALACYDPKDDEIHLETRPLFDLSEELFEASGVIGLRGVFEGGPGQSSSLLALYAEDPANCLTTAIGQLRELLDRV